MDLTQAVTLRIPRVRDPQWNEEAYLRLPLVKGGVYPWATLYDPPSEQGMIAVARERGGEEAAVKEAHAIEARAQMLWMMMGGDQWVKYEGQPCEREMRQRAERLLSPYEEA